MKIFMLAIGGRERASSRLRVWDHVTALRSAGCAVNADSAVSPGGSGTDLRFMARLIAKYPSWLRAFFAADGAVIQETLVLWPAILFKNVGKRRRIIFDFSDPIDRVGQRRWVRAIRRMLLRIMTARADAVVVENRSYLPGLAARGAVAHHTYGPVDVTRYDEARQRLGPPERGEVRVGWTGSPGTFHFIAPLMPILDRLAQTIPIELMLIGIDRVPAEMKYARVTPVTWTEASEFELVPTFDLGLWRIDDNEDSLWRGAGKLFIYMAASVPFVASDRGIGRDVMTESGVGFPLGDGIDSWRDTLKSAISAVRADPATQQARSLAYAREHLSYEAYREMLLKLLRTDAPRKT